MAVTKESRNFAEKNKEMNTTTYILDLPPCDVSFFKTLVKRFGWIAPKQPKSKMFHLEKALNAANEETLFATTL